jgi:thiamine biosynthesis protein ThiS
MTPVETGEGTRSITVNGAPRITAAGASLGDLLRVLGLDPRMIVVEHNGAILRDRDRFDARPLADGDVLELVHFVGGG